MQDINRRKSDHIDLAKDSQTGREKLDGRFYYEPLLGVHPDEKTDLNIKFMNYELGAPLWVSSMTGGAAHAGKINSNLARVCAKHRLGMGLGSCRPLLKSDQYFEDFNLRSILGDELPFFINLGIAQVEEMVLEKNLDPIHNLIKKLQANGMIVHINPLQEWLQPEGDRLRLPPIETIKELLINFNAPLIIKEVGQGMGPKSLEELIRLPIAAIEFAGFGGTNFSKLELLRQSLDTERFKVKQEFTLVGHDTIEMVDFTNEILKKLGAAAKCKEFILSGGIKSFLDGHFLMNRLSCPSVYGQASKLLEVAKVSFERLDAHVSEQLGGLKMAKSYLYKRG